MHRSRILAALGTIIGLRLALMPPAGAAQNMDPTVVVLDASGSMLQKDVGGQTRMDAAKQATTEFVSEAPRTHSSAWLPTARAPAAAMLKKKQVAGTSPCSPGLERSLATP